MGILVDICQRYPATACADRSLPGHGRRDAVSEEVVRDGLRRWSISTLRDAGARYQALRQEHLWFLYALLQQPAIYTLIVFSVIGGIFAIRFYLQLRRKKKAEDAGRVPEREAA